MKDVERYLQAGTRENTRRSYQSAIEHFEVSWGGFLPGEPAEFGKNRTLTVQASRPRLTVAC